MIGSYILTRESEKLDQLFLMFLAEVLGVIRRAGQPVSSSNWIWCQEAPDHDDNRG